MDNNIYQELYDLISSKPKVKNFKFYTSGNENHEHHLTRPEVGEFFRSVNKEDAFYETYEYIAKKQYAQLKIKDRKAFLLKLLESKKIRETKEEIESVIKTGSSRTQNYNTEYKFPYKALNILLYNNSKENNYIDKSRNYLIKSEKSFYINGSEVLMNKGLLDLVSYSFFSNEKFKLTFKGTVVLIENKESYDFAEAIFQDGEYLFMLYGGNASEKEHEFISKNITCEKMIYFGDFDYISLKEYNKLKSKINYLELFYGNDLKDLEEKIKNYGNSSLFQEQERSQEYVVENFDEVSKLIWRIVLKHEKALEQEIYHAPNL